VDQGSGGDLGSIRLAGLAALYLEKLTGLEKALSGRGVRGRNGGHVSTLRVRQKFQWLPRLTRRCTAFCLTVTLIIFTLTGELRWPPSANGQEKMEEFNSQFGHRLVWVPWQRPGFELAMMLRRAVRESPNCDGVVLGGHGLFTWGETQQACYENTIAIIDQLGQFRRRQRREQRFQAVRRTATHRALENRRDLALDIFSLFCAAGFRGLAG